MKTQSDTEASSFLRALAMELMNDPAQAARAGAGAADPSARERVAAEVAIQTLSLARERLETSKASVAFEALCVSDRDALVDSAAASLGEPAAAALRADQAAFAMIPERSACQLSAWRFSDGSFLLCSRSADDSLAQFGKALLACPALARTLGADRDASIRRALSVAANPNGAYPISKAALAGLLGSMAQEGQWKRGVRMSSREGSRSLSPTELIDALDAPVFAGTTLDQILADTLARKV